MEWESLIEADPSSTSSDNIIISDVRKLEERLQEIVYHLNPSPQHSVERQREKDKELLKDFHLLGTTSHDFNPENIKWATPLNSTILTSKLEQCLEMLEAVVGRVIEEELDLYRKQAKIAPPPTKSLDDIQPLCESMLDLMQGFQRILNRLLDNVLKQQHLSIPRDVLNFQQTKLTSLFHHFLCKTFLVEHQPPQIVKIKTKFPHPLRLRWLVGGKVMSVVWSGRLVNGSQVFADILSEIQARDLIMSTPQVVLTRGDFKSSGNLSSNRAQLEFTKTKDGLDLCVANFRHMQLRQIDRDIKRVKIKIKSGQKHRHQSTSNTTSANSISVTDEKFCILFHMQIEIAENILVIFALSHSLVVITHGSQESLATATILWDNAFSSLNLLENIPDSVTWTNISEMLSSKFQSCTGRGLDLRQLAVLRSKLIPGFSEDKSDAETIITFSRFAKLANEGTTSFWEWFYACLKLTEKHFSSYWKEGGVYGFIGRKDAERMLDGCEPGTFLLRFSDSILGGISICYVSSNGTSYSVTPFTSRDLTFRSLSDSLWDLTNLTMVYPTTPKEFVFPQSQLSAPSSVNYSILKGIFARQQSPTKKTFPLQSIPSTIIKTESSILPSSSSTPVTSSELSTSSTCTANAYVESYPKISIPQPFL